MRFCGSSLQRTLRRVVVELRRVGRHIGRRVHLVIGHLTEYSMPYSFTSAPYILRDAPCRVAVGTANDMLLVRSSGSVTDCFRCRHAASWSGCVSAPGAGCAGRLCTQVEEAVLLHLGRELDGQQRLDLALNYIFKKQKRKMNGLYTAAEINSRSNSPHKVIADLLVPLLLAHKASHPCPQQRRAAILVRAVLLYDAFTMSAVAAASAGSAFSCP